MNKSYVTVNSIETLKDLIDHIKSFEIIASCMDVIFTSEESWSAKDCTKKELFDFIESMDTKQFKLIEKFFQTMPVLKHTFKVLNPKTKVENEVTLEGLTSFFT